MFFKLYHDKNSAFFPIGWSETVSYHNGYVQYMFSKKELWVSPNWFLRKISNKALYIRLFELE